MMQKNKIYSVILSVTIAFGLWLYVVNNVSSETDITFDGIPVVREGEAVLRENNLMVTAMSTNTVSINLAGSRDDLNKIDKSNTSVKIDLSNIKEPGEKIPLTYTPSYPADVPAGAFDVSDKNPAQIYVDVDYRRTFEVPVEVKWSGTRREDFIYDTENYTLDNTMINISGPAAVADNIAKALIEVNLSDRTESISESFRYTLCDVDDRPVDAQLITTNVEEIRLDAQIQRIKEMKLIADIQYGGGATKENAVVRLSPEVIRVSGGEAVLAELGDTYNVCTINLAEIEKSTKDLKYTIALPEGVTNQTGVSEVAVTVLFTGLKTREFTIDNFQLINVPEGMTAEIINANLTIKVRGPEAEMEALKERDITAVVDFSAAEVGTATYKANIIFGEKYPNVGALKTNSVSATVQLTEE
ncbi:MAG: hypothetical protein J6J12_09825 [Oscillospiraceae bacterium]|nr:hypothetical protein [Oscillospiraceae bacterium]